MAIHRQIRYCRGMQPLPMPTPGQPAILMAPRAYLLEAIPLLAARVALNTPLQVFDGGNTFNPQPVARQLRRETSHLTACLQRIHLARAFTCHQMTTLLCRATNVHTAVLIVDLLATFHDENIPQQERRHLLKICLQHIKRISTNAPVAVTASIPQIKGQEVWLKQLEGITTHIWKLENPLRAFTPPLF